MKVSLIKEELRKVKAAKRCQRMQEHLFHFPATGTAAPPLARQWPASGERVRRFARSEPFSSFGASLPTLLKHLNQPKHTPLGIL